MAADPKHDIKFWRQEDGHMVPVEGTPVGMFSRSDDLEAMRAAHVERLLTDPKEKEKVMLDAILEIRDSDRAAKLRCETICAPGMMLRMDATDKKVDGLISLKEKTLGIIKGVSLSIAGVAGAVTLVYGAVELIKSLRGGW